MAKKSFTDKIGAEVTSNATRVMLEAAKEPKEEPIKENVSSSAAAVPAEVIKPIVRNEEATKKPKKETLSIRLNLLTKPSTKERLEAYSAEHDFESINTFVNRAINEALKREGY